LLSKKALDRQMGLEKIGGGSIKDREQAQNDSAQAEAELQRAESRIRAMGIPADREEKSRLLSLKAPMAGSIIDLQVAPGAFLNDATAAIMTIANLDSIWVTANVPEKDISFVSSDQPVKVTFPAYPGWISEGKVLFISDVLEPDTRRTKVRIAFDNADKRLKPGMFANASFSAPMISRLVVPTPALLMSNDPRHFRRGGALDLRASGVETLNTKKGTGRDRPAQPAASGRGGGRFMIDHLSFLLPEAVVGGMIALFFLRLWRLCVDTITRRCVPL
jgi:RND family efflux transporter MFP subunit